MLLTLGRHHRFGVDKLDHPLCQPPQVEVETYRGLPGNSCTRQPLRRVKQCRKPCGNRQTREGRVPSGPWYEQRGSLPRADASSRSASTS